MSPIYTEYIINITMVKLWMSRDLSEMQHELLIDAAVIESVVAFMHTLLRIGTITDFCGL